MKEVEEEGIVVLFCSWGFLFYVFWVHNKHFYKKKKKVLSSSQ